MHASFRELLERRAESIARDVAGDFPDIDVSYEVYEVELNGEQVGLIYMGDAGEWAFTNGPDGLEDRYDLAREAKQLTPYKGW